MKLIISCVLVMLVAAVPASAQSRLKLPPHLFAAGQAVAGQGPVPLPVQTAESSGPRVSLTLEDAVQRALESNLDIAVQRIGQQVFDVNIASIRSVYSPTVSSLISNSNSKNASTSTISGGQTGATINNSTFLFNGGIAFLAFGMTASSAYVLNDLLDLTADRHHPRKRYRPFASGDLAPSAGFWLVPSLLVGAGVLAMLLPAAFSLVLIVYFAGTLAYSFQLKHHVMLDVMTLAGLYTLRLIAGVVAASVAPTFWLLAFSVFIFLSLALVKRHSELSVMQREGKQEARGRGYQVADLTILSAAGIASGYLAVLILALYVNSPEVLRLYRTPEAIWLLCFVLLYWVSRMWMITHRGDMHDDPIVFALTDGPSLVIGVLAGAIVIGATL